ncbi:glutamate--tRNA ligase [Candidatus Sumerlaeota bacterium]|nr:glutamate--tRNA ligase [Candidatus Sumerlaeota bacterium]
MCDEVRVRFAPSPTGDLHLGNARTALFNYLFARHHGGKFILRIEDTDTERSTDEATQGILDALGWLGLEWDEGPFFQSERGDLYRTAIERLHNEGHVYRCFCSPEELEQMRNAAREAKQATYYQSEYQELPRDKSDALAEEGRKFVYRFRVPKGGATEWDDAIRGKVVFQHDTLDDFALARSDGSPIFLLSNAVDDADMRVSHVIRGEDHLTNTAKQIMILRALGHPVPQFAHLPMIFGMDNKKLSKRHGATFTLQFRDDGYLAEAMLNQLALVGWSLDDKTVLFSHEELTQHFSLERVNKAKGIFDYERLLWLNGHYIRELPLEELIRRSEPFFQFAGIELAGRDPEWLRGLFGLVQERVRTLKELPEKLSYFLTDALEYEEKSVNKFLKKEGVAALLRKTGEVAGAVEAFTIEGLEEAFRQWVEAEAIKFGQIAQPLRVALTGSDASPGIFEVMVYLGKERCLRRIDAAIERFCLV